MTRELVERVARAIYPGAWAERAVPSFVLDAAREESLVCAHNALAAIADAGFAVVPREPTREMLAAGADVEGMDFLSIQSKTAAECWDAMVLAAAPKP